MKTVSHISPSKQLLANGFYKFFLQHPPLSEKNPLMYIGVYYRIYVNIGFFSAAQRERVVDRQGQIIALSNRSRNLGHVQHTSLDLHLHKPILQQPRSLSYRTLFLHAV